MFGFFWNFFANYIFPIFESNKNTKINEHNNDTECYYVKLTDNSSYIF